MTNSAKEGTTMRVCFEHARASDRGGGRVIGPLSRAACVVLALGAGTSHAYEADVHFGLTRWLAAEAGFDPENAELLAKANNGLDGPALSAVPIVALSACVFSDAGGANAVRENHFATLTLVPAAPSARKIEPGNAYALQRAMARVKDPYTNLQTNLYEFGTRLHAVQDSWSHKHEPDVPHLWRARCRSDYAWSHSRDWGGWDSHDADLTWKRQSDAKAMARATYGLMCEYRRQVDKVPCPKAWPTIEDEVEAFSALKTKRGKRDWFAARGFKDVSFVRSTSLDEDEDAPAFLPYLRVEALARSSMEAAAKTDVGQFFVKFFNAWATTRRFDDVVQAFIDPELFGTPPRSDALLRFDREVATLTLQYWRALDHGRVAALGHNVSAMNANARGRLADIVARPALLQAYESAAEFLVPLNAARLPFFLQDDKLPSGETIHLAWLRLRHAPHDAVIVAAQRSAQHGLRVRSIQSVVDH